MQEEGEVPLASLLAPEEEAAPVVQPLMEGAAFPAP